MSDNQRVYVTILDKDYQIACPPEERDALHAAASDLDERMREIKNAGSTIGLERIAVMAALNLCHELQLTQKRSTSKSTDTDLATLERINEKLNRAIENQ